jgi:hypothetical protein
MHWREDALNEAPNRLGAAASPIGQKSLVALLDPQSQDRPGDHELLDLLGALEDVVGLLNTFGGSGYGQTLGFSSV